MPIKITLREQIQSSVSPSVSGQDLLCEEKLHRPQMKHFVTRAHAQPWLVWKEPLLQGLRAGLRSREAASPLLAGAPCLMPFNTILLRLMYKTED